MEASSIPDLTNVERVAAILGLTKKALLQVGLLKVILWADQERPCMIKFQRQKWTNWTNMKCL